MTRFLARKLHGGYPWIRHRDCIDLEDWENNLDWTFSWKNYFFNGNLKNSGQIYSAIDSFSVCIGRFRCIFPLREIIGPCLAYVAQLVKTRFGKNLILD